MLALSACGLATTVPVVIELGACSRALALQAACSLRLYPIVSRDWIARITAQVCRNPSLATVFRDLFDFGGQEIYFVALPEWLSGHRILDAVRSVRSAVVIGVRRPSGVELAPDPQAILTIDDDLIVIAEMADAARLVKTGTSLTTNQELKSQVAFSSEPDHISIIGWSKLGARLVEQLSVFLRSGSRIDVLSEEAEDVWEGIGPHEYDLTHMVGDATDASVLRGFLAADSIDRVVVLADRSFGTDAEAEARILLTVLELRRLDLAQSARVVAERLDARDVDLISGHGSEEFIIGDHLTCQLMAQLAEDVTVSDVFDALLAVDGPEIGVIAIESGGDPGEETTFRSLLEHLIAQGLYLIGVRRDSKVVLNPDQDATIHLASGDELIVVRPEPRRQATD